MTKDIEKALRKLLREDGVSGYSLKDNKIIIYVESDQHALRYRALAFEGYEVEIRVIGKLRLL
jgi:hypothetical protein